MARGLQAGDKSVESATFLCPQFRGAIGLDTPALMPTHLLSFNGRLGEGVRMEIRDPIVNTLLFVALTLFVMDMVLVLAALA